MKLNRLLLTLGVLAVCGGVAAQEPSVAPAESVRQPLSDSSVSDSSVSDSSVSDSSVRQRPGESKRDDRQIEVRISELSRSANRNIALSHWREAIKDVKELVVLRPFDAEFQLTLGLLFLKAGNLEHARRKYEDFMGLGGSDAVGHMLIAESYAAKSFSANREKVFDHLRQAAENGMNLMKGVEGFESLRTLRDDTEFVQLALRLERYVVDLANFVDPMASKFQKASDNGPDLDESPSNSAWTIERQERHILEAQEQLAAIDFALVASDEKQAMEAYGSLVDLCDQRYRITATNLKAAMRKISASRKEIESRMEEMRLKFLYGRSLALIDDMRIAFRNEDYPRVNTLFGDVKTKANSMLEINDSFQEVSDRIILVAEVLVRKSKIRREFSAKTLRIQGIVHERENRVAIINDRSLKEGDSFDDMRVILIEANRVLFRFKGENVPLVFRRY